MPDSHVSHAVKHPTKALGTMLQESTDLFTVLKLPLEESAWYVLSNLLRL